MAKNETGVAIIGGGAAGVAAARRLSDAGVDCLLIEARDRLGGRGFTADVAGYPVDLGCGWLHSAEQNPWAGVARRQGRDIDRTTPPWMRPTEQRGFPIAQQKQFRVEMNAFFERIGELAERTPDPTVAAALVPGGRWNGLLSAVSTYISGAEPEKLSALDFHRYESDDMNWRVVEGYGATIADHAHGVPVAMSCPVTRIDHSGARIRVETDKGAIVAEKVIVTLPTDIIAAHDDLFAPALPGKTEAARGLPLGLADKLFVSLERAEEFEADSRLFGGTDRAEIATYHMRPFGRPMIECYFGGHNAHDLEQGGVRAFFDFAAKELTALLGNAFAARIKPLAMHLWASDPFARGSYSYAVPGRAGDRAKLAETVDGRLFFAGEACSPNFFTTAHGAFLTGVQAADAILAARK